jgi:uncharacterized membrane-anchored protein
MAFLVPEYTTDPFWSGENARGETIVCPTRDMSLAAFIRASDVDANTVDVVTGKHWARLSAPGYLDATEWAGPFETIEEAHAYMRETVNVDPVTGEELG